MRGTHIVGSRRGAARVVLALFGSPPLASPLSVVDLSSRFLTRFASFAFPHVVFPATPPRLLHSSTSPPSWSACPPPSPSFGWYADARTPRALSMRRTHPLADAHPTRTPPSRTSHLLAHSNMLTISLLPPPPPPSLFGCRRSSALRSPSPSVSSPCRTRSEPRHGVNGAKGVSFRRCELRQGLWTAGLLPTRPTEPKEGRAPGEHRAATVPPRIECLPTAWPVVKC